MDVNQIKEKIRSTPYMAGIDQNSQKIKQFGQMFTPNEYARLAVDSLYRNDPTLFTDSTKTIIDPCGCGSGELLLEALVKKMECGQSHEQSLKTIFGVDIDPEMVEICRDRLLCGDEQHRYIVEKNIICADSLKMTNWEFDGQDPYRTRYDDLFE